MAMERLSEILRQQGNERDKRIAYDIDEFIKLRGSDITIAEFAGVNSSAKSHPRDVRLFEPIAASIKVKILSGEYRVGYKLDYKILARQYNVSIETINSALNLLQEESLVDRKQRRGTIVTKPNLQV